jgi:hypothetical protein
VFFFSCTEFSAKLEFLDDFHCDVAPALSFDSPAVEETCGGVLIGLCNVLGE